MWQVEKHDRQALRIHKYKSFSSFPHLFVSHSRVVALPACLNSISMLVCALQSPGEWLSCKWWPPPAVSVFHHPSMAGVPPGDSHAGIREREGQLNQLSQALINHKPQRRRLQEWNEREYCWYDEWTRLGWVVCDLNAIDGNAATVYNNTTSARKKEWGRLPEYY